MCLWVQRLKSTSSAHSTAKGEKIFIRRTYSWSTELSAKVIRWKQCSDYPHLREAMITLFRKSTNPGSQIVPVINHPNHFDSHQFCPQKNQPNKTHLLVLRGRLYFFIVFGVKKYYSLLVDLSLLQPHFSVSGGSSSGSNYVPVPLSRWLYFFLQTFFMDPLSYSFCRFSQMVYPISVFIDWVQNWIILKMLPFCHVRFSFSEK